MRCGARDAAECLTDHVWPYLTDPRPADDGNGYRALAPCHPDRTHSLSVSDGGHGLVVWNCFACLKRHGRTESQIRTRAALIDARVPAICLNLGTASQIEYDDAIRSIVFGKDEHAPKVLRLAAYLRGYGMELPTGRELRALCEDCGVSLAAAYEFRKGA